MRRFLLRFTLITLLLGCAFYFFGLPAVTDKLQDSLRTTGLKHANIIEPRYDFSGASIAKITLDKEGFSHAETVRLDFSWLDIIFDDKVQAVTIEKLKLSTLSKDVKAVLYLFHESAPALLAEQDVPVITIKNLTWDILHKNVIYTVGGTLQNSKNAPRDFVADIFSHQKTLNFDATLSLSLQEPSGLKANATIKNVFFRQNDFIINRGFGWLSFSFQETPELYVDLEAPSGTLKTHPFNQFKLVVSPEDTETHLLSIRLSQDMLNQFRLSHDMSIDTMLALKEQTTTLHIEETQDFDNPWQDTKTTLTYMQERRFANGPYPYEFSFSRLDEPQASGTLLLYPETGDLRGSLTGEPPALQLFSNLFAQNDAENVTDTLRIESNVQYLLPATDTRRNQK